MSISDRLDQMQARADAATEGPWTWASHRTVDGDEWAVFDPHDWAMASNSDGWAPDAEFIAASRTDVPALVAAVRTVLDACDRIDASIIPSGDFEVGQKSVTQTVRMVVERKLSTVPSAAESVRAIATALGQEARNGQ